MRTITTLMRASPRLPTLESLRKKQSKTLSSLTSVRPLIGTKYRRIMSMSSSITNSTNTDTATATIVEKREDVIDIVQYIVLRRDLIDKWPLGSVVTQGCHASVAAVWENKDDPTTLEYCSLANIDSMHKVTLEVKGETQLMKLSEKLKGGRVTHKMWIEQPENFPTCLATKPYPKSFVSPFLKNLKLCK